MLTNLQLVDYVKAAHAAKWVYWYGTCGYKCTDSLYSRKRAQYPAHYTAARESGYKADIAAGRMCADCVGLIKSFFWTGGIIGGTNKYQSNGCPDTSANGMINLCKETGPIKTIPDIPGLVVWKDGHIGVYIGGGYTIEERGFAYDCVKRKVTDGPWTKWGRLPMLEYTDKPTVTYKLGERALTVGDEGADVQELQTALMRLGYSFPKYGADGDFGSETEGNVKTFRRDHGLEATGVFDASAFKALAEALNAPADTPAQPPAEEPDTPDGGGEPAYVLIIEGDRKKLELVQLAYGGTLAAVDSVKVVSE